MKIFKIYFQASPYLDKHYKEKAAFEVFLKDANIEILNYFNGLASSLIYKVKVKTKLFGYYNNIKKYTGVKSITPWTTKDEQTWLLRKEEK